MAAFEQACRDKGLDLFVLPPKRPQLNGAVERCNGSWRYEFYAVHDPPHQIDRLQPFVDAFAHRYNHHRPHDALDGQTPAEYLAAQGGANLKRLICLEPGHLFEIQHKSVYKSPEAAPETRREANRRKSAVSKKSRPIFAPPAAARKPGEALGEYAYRTLREAIAEGDFQPGHALREADVAAWLDISRTPVREAFRRLVSEGLLSIGSWNGAVVASLDTQQLVELYAVRAALEGTAANLAAQHASPAEIQNLLAIARKEAASGDDPELLVRINGDLHRTIYCAAHNRYLLQSLNALADTLGLLRHSTFMVPGSVEKARREHLDLINAIRDRKPDLAQSLAIAHVNRALELRLQLPNYGA